MRLILRRELDRPIMLGLGDRLAISYVEIEGVVRHEHETTIAIVKPHRAITVTEVATFETEFEGRKGYVAMLLEKKP